MKNGIYANREIQFSVYEKEGGTPFVVVKNDRYENHHIVLDGEHAERLIRAIADCLNVIDEEKGS